MKKSFLCILLCLALTGVLIGCDLFSRSHEPEEDGTLVIKANISSVLTQELSLDSILEEVTLNEIVCTISQGDTIHTEVLVMDDAEDEIEVVFDSVSPGNWDIYVLVVCEEGFHIMEGAEEGTVLSNETTDVKVTLDLVPADLELEVLFPEDEDIRSGRVTLLGLVDDVATIEEFFEADSGGTITFMMRDLLPRIWFINCELYDDEEVVLYSVKAQILLLPGRTTRAELELEEGVLHIIIDWNLPPEKPRNVTAVYAYDTVTLNWDAVEGAVGYMVVRSATATGWGTPLTNELIEETFIKDSSGFAGGRTYWYRVVAFNKEGFSSTYSEAVSVVGVDDRTSHTVADIEFSMRRAPASTFPTGASDRGEATVDHDFWVGETLVTYELWYEVRIWALDNGYTFFSDGQEGSHGQEGEEPTEKKQEPVTRVNWYDSIVWCNALSEYLGFDPVYMVDDVVVRDARELTEEDAHEDVMASNTNGFRLPGSEEWELAARYKGNDSSHGAIEYPDGSGNYWTPGNYASGATDEYTNEEATQAAAWYYELEGGNTLQTQDVGLKPENGNGLKVFDMSGNVWEWCFDLRFDVSRERRGGSYRYSSDALQVGVRNSWIPASVTVHNGFRFVRTYF